MDGNNDDNDVIMSRVVVSDVDIGVVSDDVDLTKESEPT